jgi:hypothetical protein
MFPTPAKQYDPTNEAAFRSALAQALLKLQRAPVSDSTPSSNAYGDLWLDAVEDFGAIGDGNADDADKIQAGLDWMYTNMAATGVRTLVLPPSRCVQPPASNAGQGLGYALGHPLWMKMGGVRLIGVDQSNYGSPYSAGSTLNPCYAYGPAIYVATPNAALQTAPSLASGPGHACTFWPGWQNSGFYLRQAATMDLKGLTAFTAECWIKHIGPGNFKVDGVQPLAGMANMHVVGNYLKGDTVITVAADPGHTISGTLPLGCPFYMPGVPYNGGFNLADGTVVGNQVLVTISALPYDVPASDGTEFDVFVAVQGGGALPTADYTTTNGLHNCQRPDNYGRSAITFGLDWQANVGPSFYLTTSAGNVQLHDTSTAYPMDTVYHVAASWDGTTVRLFLNGVLKASAALGGHLNPSDLEESLWGFGESVIVDGLRISNNARYTFGFATPTTKFTLDANTLILANGDKAIGSMLRIETCDGDFWAPCVNSYSASTPKDFITNPNGYTIKGITIFGNLGFGPSWAHGGKVTVRTPYAVLASGIFIDTATAGLLEDISTLYCREGVRRQGSTWGVKIKGLYCDSSGGRFGYRADGASGISHFDSCWFYYGMIPFYSNISSLSFTKCYWELDSTTMYGAVFLHGDIVPGTVTMTGCSFASENILGPEFRAFIAVGGAYNFSAQMLSLVNTVFAMWGASSAMVFVEASGWVGALFDYCSFSVARVASLPSELVAALPDGPTSIGARALSPWTFRSCLRPNSIPLSTTRGFCANVTPGRVYTPVGLEGAPVLSQAQNATDTQVTLAIASAPGSPLVGTIYAGDTFTIAGEAGSPVHTVTGGPYSPDPADQYYRVGPVSFTGAIAAGGVPRGAAVTLTQSAQSTFDCTQGDQFNLTLTQNVTASSVVGAGDGQRITITITQDGIGGRTFAWPSNFVSPPSVAAGANAVTSQSFVFDGTNWYKD